MDGGQMDERIFSLHLAKLRGLVCSNDMSNWVTVRRLQAVHKLPTHSFVDYQVKQFNVMAVVGKMFCDPAITEPLFTVVDLPTSVACWLDQDSKAFEKPSVMIGKHFSWRFKFPWIFSNNISSSSESICSRLPANSLLRQLPSTPSSSKEIWKRICSLSSAKFSCLSQKSGNNFSMRIFCG